MANFRGESISVLPPKRGPRAQSMHANPPPHLSRLLTRECRSASFICHQSHVELILSLKLRSLSAHVNILRFAPPELRSMVNGSGLRLYTVARGKSQEGCGFDVLG